MRSGDDSEPPALLRSASAGLQRLHFDAATGLGLAFLSSGGCTVIDLRDEESAADNEGAHFLDLGFALWGDAPAGMSKIVTNCCAPSQ